MANSKSETLRAGSAEDDERAPGDDLYQQRKVELQELRETDAKPVMPTE
jgi:hypothetical protein